MIPKIRVWDTVKKAMHDVQAIVYTEERVYPIYSKLIRKYIPFGEAILMQYTGLKDKNGVEIFEGDIVKSCRLVNGHIYEYVGQVKFVDFSWNIVDKKYTYDPFYNYTDGYPDEIWEIEVIGNIYENPDLLESVEE